jgi:hypothetical protein
MMDLDKKICTSFNMKKFVISIYKRKHFVFTGLDNHDIAQFRDGLIILLERTI